MTEVARHQCNVCATPIGAAELAQGQAVRVGREYVCPHCIDTLPTDAQVRINQLRALRGYDATIYRYRHPKFPQLKLFTFTTNLQIRRHYRMLHEGRELEAPVIGPRSSVASGRPTSGQLATVVQRSTPTSLLIIGGAVLAGLIVLVSVLVTRSGGGNETASPHLSANTGEQDDGARSRNDGGARTTAQRSDYANDPLQAWQRAAGELPPDHPLLGTLAAEIEAQRERDLATATQALENDELTLARDALGRTRVPDHPLLRRLQRRGRALRERIDTRAAAIAAARAAEEEAAATTADDGDGDGTDDADTRLAGEDGAPHGAETEQPDPEPTPPAPQELAAPDDAEGYRFSVGELLQIDDPRWESISGGGLRLREHIGSLSRQLQLDGGRYRVWVHVRGPIPAGASLTCRLGGETLQLLEPPAVDRWSWLELPGDGIDVAGGAQRIDLMAVGAGWQLVRVQIIDARIERPTAMDNPSAPRWVEEPQTVDEPEKTDEAEQPGDRVQVLQVAGDTPSYDAYDPADLVPQGLPGGVGPLVWGTERQRRRGQSIALQLPQPTDLAEGGVALLIHPVRRDRDRVQPILVDAEGHEHELPEQELEAGSWQVVTFRLPPADDGQRGFDITAVTALRLDDPERHRSTRFLLGKAVAVGGRAAERDDLDLRPRALRPLDYEALADVLQEVTVNRRKRRWYHDFDADNAQFLVGHQLFKPSWRKLFYDDMQALFGERPANGTIKALVMHDPWLDGTFIIPPQVIDQRYHMVVVATAGVEFPIGLDQQQALINFWHKMLIETKDSGILPVVVLGPTKVDPQHQDVAEQLWVAIDKLLRERHRGVPLLDLRPVGKARMHRFKPGQADDSARMLAEGYHELRMRIVKLQEMRRR